MQTVPKGQTNGALVQYALGGKLPVQTPPVQNEFVGHSKLSVQFDPTVGTAG